MSVINQMLRDLDQREALAMAGPLPGDVRPMPADKAQLPWRMAAVAAVVVGILVGAAALWVPTENSATQPHVASITPIAQAAQVPVQRPMILASAAAPDSLPTPDSAPPATAGAIVLAANAEAVAEPVARVRPAGRLAGRPAAIDGTFDTRLRMDPSIDMARPVEVQEVWGAAPTQPQSMAMVPPRATDRQPSSIEKHDRTSSAQEVAESDYQRAVALVNQGRAPEAMDGLREALQADAAHANARALLANILIEQKKLDEARAILAQGLALKPAQPVLALRLARIQVEQGDLAGAADTLQGASQAASRLPEYRGFHAALLQRLSRHKAAIGEFQAALALAPQSGVWWMGLGLSLESDLRPAEAREAFQNARATRSLSAELDRFVEHKLQPRP
jgi:MSHA biogenesis protein MshN